MTWGDLAKYVCEELGEEPEEGVQDTFDELCDYQNRREEVYELVRRRLSKVKADEHLAQILNLPWLGIYTTNYDTAIEDYYRDSGAAHPIVISRGKRTVQFGIPNEILIFKLMGSRTADPGQPGEMVLSTIDRRRHQREQGEMYEHLDALVYAQAILGLGYSFADHLLLEAVQQVRSLRVQRQMPVFALFRPNSRIPMIQRLEKLGVRVIRENFGDFAGSLVRSVGQAAGEELISLRYKGAAIMLKPQSIRDTIHAFDLVGQDETHRPISSEEFLRGDTSRSIAYEKKLHWVRKAISRARLVLDDWFEKGQHPELVINFKGRPGSGRTVASNDLLNYVLTNHACVGLRLAQRSPRLDDVAATQLMAQVIDNVGEAEPPCLAVLTDDHVSLSDVLTFLYEIRATSGGVIVIRSSRNVLTETSARTEVVDLHEIELPDNVEEEDTISLGEYISGLPSSIRPRWSGEEIKYAIKQDPSFIESMYRLVDPARRSISDIVLEEHAELSMRARRVVDSLLIPSSVRVDAPLTMLAKLHDLGYAELYSVLEECEKLVRVHDDGVSNPHAGLYHPRVADILLSTPANLREAKESLHKMLEVANLVGGSEHQVVAELLIGKPGEDPPVESLLEDDEILDLFLSARARGASRLLLHHYGLRLRRAEIFDEATKVLREALDVHEDEYRPSERKEIVETSLAHVQWLKLKHEDPEYLSRDPRLQQIRDDLRRARMRSRWNPHSYDIEARILEDLAVRSERLEGLTLFGEALGILKDGLAASGGTNTRLVERIRDVAEASTGFSESDAEELLRVFQNGYGYFLLFERARQQGKNEAAGGFLLRALRAPVPCPPAIREAIHEELGSGDPDYFRALNRSDTLFDYAGDHPREVSVNWTDQLQRIACLVGSGKGRQATPYILEVRRTAPKNLPQAFPYFLRSGGVRAEFAGLVGAISSSAVGFIKSHSVPGINQDLFFNPSRGKVPAHFRAGDTVKFNLAIGVYGLTAWDVTLG